MDPGYIQGNAEVREAKQLLRPSLPKCGQWLTFIREKAHKMPKDGIGWISLMRDGTIELHLLALIAARRLRGNPEWDIQGTMTQDTERLETQARRLLAKVESIDDKDIPVRLEHLWDTFKGAIKNQVRLAREIDKMQLSGQLFVDVTIDRPAQQLVEDG